MIYCMNIGDSDIKEIKLHGNHHANIVYCNKFEFGHEKLGFLYCNDVIVARITAFTVHLNEILRRLFRKKNCTIQIKIRGFGPFVLRKNYDLLYEYR
ncbi:hypothetical protein Sf24_gp122 [Shigella phage Sf24]|uniref:DUF7418 domain-containing protein n=1 Tax=Shigella phage Sf24 TaxID=2024309 RepID=A0A2K9VLA0_9CAUD|nr:hypothetical protein FDJ03_gp122 [Shigella phage Sf24]AUV63131.1 hypothetical protein Sf24_gp122 [Shigella phage Sf24]